MTDSMDRFPPASETESNIHIDLDVMLDRVNTNPHCNQTGIIRWEVQHRFWNRKVYKQANQAIISGERISLSVKVGKEDKKPLKLLGHIVELSLKRTDHLRTREQIEGYFTFEGREE